MNEPKPYQLFSLCPPDAHIHLSHLVQSLWRSSFSHRGYREDYFLDYLFFRFFMHPEETSLSICPYFFDQVTADLWKFHRRQPRDFSCLCLCCFHSWSNLKEEILRTFLSTAEERRNGVHFDLCCCPFARNTNRILSGRQYLLKLSKFTSFAP